MKVNVLMHILEVPIMNLFCNIKNHKTILKVRNDF